MALTIGQQHGKTGLGGHRDGIPGRNYEPSRHRGAVRRNGRGDKEESKEAGVGTQNITQVRKNGTQKHGAYHEEACQLRRSAKAFAARIRTSRRYETRSGTQKVVTNHPPFQPGNQYALKHGGYARRLLLKDEVVEDARALTLEDELFRLRANNLMAAENIGRWFTLLEDAEEEQQRKILMDNISAAEKAMMRNTVRIESIVGTLATVSKIHADTDYRLAATDKVSLEADRLRRDAGIDDGNGERDLNDFYADIQTDA